MCFASKDDQESPRFQLTEHQLPCFHVSKDAVSAVFHVAKLAMFETGNYNYSS